MIAIDVVAVYCYTYVKDCFRAVMPSSFRTLAMFIHYFGHMVCMSVFYHPNSSNIFDTLFINPRRACAERVTVVVSCVCVCVYVCMFVRTRYSGSTRN